MVFGVCKKINYLNYLLNHLKIYLKKLLQLTIPNEPNAIKAEKLKFISQKYMPADRKLHNIQ